MAYCSHCGTELTGRFCAKCGSPAPVTPEDQPPPPPRPTPPGPPPPGPPPPSLSIPGLQDNVASALCYLALVVTGVLFLFLEPYNRNKAIRFHAFQSIFVWIGIMLADAAVRIVFGTILDSRSYELMRLIWTVYELGVLALWLTLMYRAYNREVWVVPVAGEMAQRFA